VASLNRRVMIARQSTAMFASVMRQFVPGNAASGGTRQQTARPTDNRVTEHAATDYSDNGAGSFVEPQASTVAVARIAVMLHAVVMVPCFNRAGEAQRHNGEGQCPEAALWLHVIVLVLCQRKVSPVTDSNSVAFDFGSVGVAGSQDDHPLLARHLTVARDPATTGIIADLAPTPASQAAIDRYADIAGRTLHGRGIESGAGKHCCGTHGVTVHRRRPRPGTAQAREPP